MKFFQNKKYSHSNSEISLKKAMFDQNRNFCKNCILDEKRLFSTEIVIFQKSQYFFKFQPKKAIFD